MQMPASLAPLVPALAVLAAYLVGSLSFAVIVSRLMGLADPRSYGSKNPGATNVLRSGNKAAAVLTLVLDALKGYVPVLLALLWRDRLGLSELVIAMVGLAAFLGHLWPVFFRFEGGLLALNPHLGLATLVSWVIVAFFLRYSSLASLVAAVFASFYQLLVWGGGDLMVAILPMSLLLIWRHAGNIRRLLDGTESRIGGKGAASGSPQPSSPSSSSTPSHRSRKP
jgi:glycerol-3-phosphate acyltransferase PlsY